LNEISTIHPVSHVTRATPLAAYRTVDAPADPGESSVARLADLSREFSSDISFVIHQSLESIEAEWRRFEQFADCTAFQSFDWLTAWYRRLGLAEGIIPVVAVGSFANGEIALIVPLAIQRDRASRRLCWFGQDQCDYNAPLLSPDFSQRVPLDRFLIAWRELRELIQRAPRLRYDWIEVEKMPRMVGAQINPFTYLPVTDNPSGAHLTHLGDDWEKFYFAKRSSATRRRDRTKRRHMSEFGEIRFITCTDPDDSRRTLEALFYSPRYSRHIPARGFQGIFLRSRLKRKPEAPVSHQPYRSRRYIGGNQLRHRFRRLLLSRIGELRRYRGGLALWSRRAASARIAGLRDRLQAAAVRLHDRR
jgi:hypothetical protein